MSNYLVLTPDGSIAGVDEAGRGPLAGPLLVAAVVLDPDRPISGLNDSKKLSAPRRSALHDEILAKALHVAIEIIEPAEIDRLNILQATLTGMRRVVQSLGTMPTLALIDGNRIPSGMPCPARAIVGGDALEPAISAASIVAKVTRDRLMIDIHLRFPDYGFDQHKGYPTLLHRQCLATLGPCPVHRLSYAPVRHAAARLGLFPTALE